MAGERDQHGVVLAPAGEQELQLAADLVGLGREPQVLRRRRLGDDHDVLRRVASGNQGAGEGLDIGLRVRQVAQLVGVVLAHAHEQGELLPGRLRGPRRGGHDQKRHGRRGCATGTHGLHGTPRGTRVRHRRSTGELTRT